MIPLGDLAPDAPSVGTHCVTANNCIPYIGYYGPFYSAVAYTPASTEAALGAFASRSSSGTPYNFIGGATKLQKITSAAWEDVTRTVGGAYATPAETKWDFTTFGNYVIATNYADDVQVYTMGTSTDFSQLSATAPKAKYCATVRGFVMLGNIPSYPNRVQWGPLEAPTGVWTPSTTTQADYQDLYGEAEVGQVMKVVGGEYATIFMEKGIFRGTYVGGSTIFTFDQIVRSTGTLSGGSVAAYGENIFFLGNDGFYMLGPGGLKSIGDGKVNRTFFREVYSAEYWRMSAVIDPKNSLYIVGYPVSTGVINKLLIYNWLADKWTTVTPGNMEVLFNLYSESMSADSAAALSLIGAPDSGAYTSVSADSSLFIGGKPNLAAINSSHKATIFDGAAMDAVLETAEQQITPGRKTTVRTISPIVEDYSIIQVMVRYRNALSDIVNYSNPTSVNAEGEAHILNQSRYQRLYMVLSGGFSKASGFNVDAVPAGKY